MTRIELTKRWGVLVGLTTAFFLVFIVPAIELRRDWGFVDLNTGSRMGYTEWMFGVRTGAWHEETALERFIRREEGSTVQQSWVSYAGTGRNLWGRAVSVGHGRPGPILQLTPQIIDDHCNGASAEEKRQLYGVLCGGDQSEIRDSVDRILSKHIAAQKQQ